MPRGGLYGRAAYTGPNNKARDDRIHTLRGAFFVRGHTHEAHAKRYATRDARATHTCARGGRSLRRVCGVVGLGRDRRQGPTTHTT